MTTRYTIVVDQTADWKWSKEGLVLMSADEFMTKGQPESNRVIILCRRYRYLSAGYYCCLLAEARGYVPMPTVADVLSLSRKSFGGTLRNRPHPYPGLLNRLDRLGRSRHLSSDGCLLQDQVRVGAADPERGHRRGAGMIAVRPGNGLGQQPNRPG